MEILDKKEQRSKRITKYILIAVSVFFAVTMLIIPLAAVIVNSLREGVSFYFKALSTKYVLSALIVTLSRLICSQNFRSRERTCFQR